MRVVMFAGTLTITYDDIYSSSCDQAVGGTAHRPEGTIKAWSLSLSPCSFSAALSLSLRTGEAADVGPLFLLSSLFGDSLPASTTASAVTVSACCTTVVAS